MGYMKTSPGHFRGGPLPAMIDAPPILGTGALPRPRSDSENGGGELDRSWERQLVGSLTNSYKFKESGLVKKVRPRDRPFEGDSS